MYVQYAVGEHMFDTILKTVSEMGLDMAQCRGQAYNGTAEMCEGIKSCATLVSEKYPLALQQHCRSHCLNISILKVSKGIPGVSEYLTTF